MTNIITRAWLGASNLVDRCVGGERSEHGQVGNIVLIGVLVVLAVVAGVLIFHAVSHSAASTASCISNPNAASCQSLP